MQLAKQKIEILARSKQGKTKCLNIYDAINIQPPDNTIVIYLEYFQVALLLGLYPF